jgi:hypothetical protein
MKNNKALKLIKMGLSPKTVEKLNEGQINTLYSKLISEQSGVTRVTKPVTVTTISQSALKTPQGVSVDGQQAKMDSSGNIVFTKSAQTEEVDEDASSNTKKNPWAICTAQLGKEFGTKERHLWSAKEKNKYERCVKDVKKSLKEGKNPVSLFLENQIMRIVEKNLPPRITKGDLMRHLMEAPEPAVAPTKPKTRPEPTTKPGKPDKKPVIKPSNPGKNPRPGVNPGPMASKPAEAPTKPKTRPEPTTKPGKPDKKPVIKPSNPGKNPRPGVNPGPMAMSPEKAKDEIIDLIINLLEK